MKYYISILISLILFLSCDTSSKKGIPQEDIKTFEKGTFGYDVDFFNKNEKEIIVLKNEKSSLLVSPEYQGRVMTSTAEGLEGKSFGWINYKLIESGEVQEHINAFGGEERFWLGPEAGQFTIFFKEGMDFTLENWFVPREIDTESFDVVSSSEAQAIFQKEMHLTNYSGTKLDLKVNRKISLLKFDQQEKILGVKLPPTVNVVGYTSENTITNIGENEWTKETGTLSIWILSILNPSDHTVGIFPFVPGNEEELGNIVTSDYFGEILPERLVVKDSVIYFACDGKQRGKIGINPKRAKPFAGSYDSENGILTIANYSLPDNNIEYVNSLWKIQDNPFGGDAVNSYNDEPLNEGSQIGSFYELESSSPAAFLAPNQSLTHIHRTFHFVGEKEKLNEISMQLLGVSLEEIQNSIKL